MFILQRSQVIWSQDNITINTFWSNYRKCEQHFHSTRNAERFAGVLYRVTKTGWPRKTITTPPPTRLRAWASCPSGVLHSITITYQTIGTRINNLCKHMSTITHNLKLAMNWFSFHLIITIRNAYYYHKELLSLLRILLGVCFVILAIWFLRH